MKRHFGIGWLIFRLSYGFCLRSGVMQWPMSLIRRNTLRHSNQLSARKRSAFFFDNVPAAEHIANPGAALAEAEAILTGQLTLFFRYSISGWVPTGLAR